MVHHLDVENLLEGRFDLLDAGVTKLQNFTGVGEDHMVVLLDPVAFLVLGALVSKLMRRTKLQSSNKSNVLYNVARDTRYSPLPITS